MRFIIIIFTCIITSNAYAYENILMQTLYHQGALSDTLICYFKRIPTCITEPYIHKTVDDSHKIISYFMPLITLENQDFIKIIQTIADQKRDYTIQMEFVNKPLKGIKLTIAYNAKMIEFICDRKQIDPHNNTLSFRFIYKNVLNNSSQKTNASTASTRWYVLGKRQPRIVLDSTDYSDTGLSFVQALAQELKMQNHEVIMLTEKEREVQPEGADASLDTRTSYVNIVLQSDICIMLDPRNHYALTALAKSFYESSVKQDLLYTSLKRALKKWLKITSVLDKTVLGKKERLSAFLTGTEMPSIGITYNKRANQNSLVKAIALGVKRYLRYMQNKVQ